MIHDDSHELEHFGVVRSRAERQIAPARMTIFIDCPESMLRFIEERQPHEMGAILGVYAADAAKRLLAERLS